MLAGTGVPGTEVLKLRGEAIIRASSGLSQSNYYYVRSVFMVCPSLASHSNYLNNSGST
jgi:hypothetical protein